MYNYKCIGGKGLGECGETFKTLKAARTHDNQHNHTVIDFRGTSIRNYPTSENDTMRENESIKVRIDDRTWRPSNDETAEYDAVHTIAGAILAGAEQITFEKEVENDA